MANIFVKEFTYKTYSDNGDPVVEIYANGVLIKTKTFVQVNYNEQTALQAVKETESFGFLGPGNIDFYQLEPPTNAATSAETITISDKYIAPDPETESKKTPQEVNDQTQKESDKSAEQQTITSLSQTDDKALTNNIPSNLKPQGSDKLAIILNKKGSEIKKFIIPIIVTLATQMGIKYIGTAKAKIPDTCLSKSELDKIVKTRNQLVNKLNDIVKIIDTFSKILVGIGVITGITSALIKTINASRIAISVATKAIPTIPVPGSVLTSLNDLKDAQDIAVTRLAQISGVTAAVGLSLIAINSTLLKVIGMLNSIDSYLKQCAPDATLIPLSNTLLELVKVNNEIKQTDNQQTYNGFILEIVEEPYSSTVKRRKAVAKNKQGIILLSTPLTFSTDTQTLINEIKLVIDSSDLKAY